MLEKYKEWFEDHYEAISFITFILCPLMMIFGEYFLSNSFFTYFFAVIIFEIWFIIPIFLYIMDYFKIIPKVLDRSNHQSDFDFESDLCLGCPRCSESKEDSYKRKRHKIRDMLKEYKEKTDVKEAKQLRKMLKTLEENCVPIPKSVERQQMPLLEEALYAFLKLPDSVPKKFRKQMEKDTNEIIHIVLEQLQQVFDSYYDEKAKKIAINKTVVEWLNPEDPFNPRNQENRSFFKRKPPLQGA